MRYKFNLNILILFQCITSNLFTSNILNGLYITCIFKGNLIKVFILPILPICIILIKINSLHVVVPYVYLYSY
jgi:hypothetical protein